MGGNEMMTEKEYEMRTEQGVDDCYYTLKTWGFKEALKELESIRDYSEGDEGYLLGWRHQMWIWASVGADIVISDKGGF
jgi:hypothetical protein